MGIYLRLQVCHYRYLHLPYRQAADELIKTWDATIGDTVQTFSGHSEGISDIAWPFIMTASPQRLMTRRFGSGAWL